MTPSSSSFVTSENSVPKLSFSTASSSYISFLRSREAIGEERPTFRSSHGLKSTLTSSSLYPNSASISPYSFLSLPGGPDPSMLLNSPMSLSSSNILASQTSVSTFPTETFNWRGNNTNHQQEFKEDSKSYSNLSFQTSTRPASLQTSFFHPPSKEFMASKEEAFKIHDQQLRMHQQLTLINSNEIPTLLASSQAENNNSYSDISTQSMSEQRRLHDGYNWRKYGQKQVKGSDNPRSYYKCTHPNCPTKKKVERSLDGYITKIIYKGTHSHSKPQRTRRNSSSFQGLQGSIHQEGKDHSFNGPFDVPADSITTESFSALYDDDDIDMNSQKMIAGGDYDEEEPDAKKWKMGGEDGGVSNSYNGTVREPKVVVQTTSDIDILDDGYRWRKYGQKVVKGNPNPRSYYKCTTYGCLVRKHVERASTDLRAVITTYEGKHNHGVPTSRGSGSWMNKTVLGNNNIDNNNNNNNKNNTINNDYNMSCYAMAISPLVNESQGWKMASDSIFSTRHSGFDCVGFSGNDISMNSLFSNQLEQQNQLQHIQKQGPSMLSKAKEEPRDDLFFDSLLK